MQIENTPRIARLRQSIGRRIEAYITEYHMRASKHRARTTPAIRR
jgi:hypothetical protein